MMYIRSRTDGDIEVFVDGAPITVSGIRVAPHVWTTVGPTLELKGVRGCDITHASRIPDHLKQM